MFSTLLEIAWGDRANFLNQLFSIMLVMITVTQAFRFFVFWDRINQWSRAFVSAKIAFDREKTVELQSRLDELQPPHSASDQLWIVIPPVLIMFGLIGTFIGLTLALAVIPFGGSPADIQKGVQEALPSMGSAFWTSLSAICSSLVIRLTTMFMESMFKRRVLNVIVTAHPHLVQYIEREAFLQNKPGALLRPHSLREVLWQQHIEFNKQIERLGNEISSSIRVLPFALPQPPLSANTKHSTTTTDSAPSSMDSAPLLTTDQSENNAPHAESLSTSSPQDQESLNTPLNTTSSSFTPGSVDMQILLSEMRKQTALLERLVVNQQRAHSSQRIALATQGFQSLNLDERGEREGSR